MKAKLLRSVVLVALVIASVFTATLSAKNVFVTNDEVKNEQVISRTIYRLDDYLYRHIKYNYTYSESGYMSVKEAFKWDAGKQSWTPYYLVDLTYGNGEVIMDYARWNEKDQTYNIGRERSTYDFNGNNEVMEYVNEKWDEKESEWKLVYNMDYVNGGSIFAISE